MRIAFDCPTPAPLAHGGVQIQIQNTLDALRSLGVDAEPLRWWDDSQEFDILHYFGRPGDFYTKLVRAKGAKLVISDLLTSQGSRTALQRVPHAILRLVDRLTFGKLIAPKCGWTSYHLADAVIALTPWEATLMAEMFGVPRERIQVIPNGVEEVFFLNPKSKIQNPKSPFLVCTATITERKRVVELAEAAVFARVPVWVLGKPYSETDPYFRRFLALHRAHPEIIKYEGAISDRSQLAAIYQSARGFVLLSTMESLSLSALEATAAGCPLLLSDLPWARCTFGDTASYAGPNWDAHKTGAALRRFYEAAPTLPVPPPPMTWQEVAIQIKGIYEKISR